MNDLMVQLENLIILNLLSVKNLKNEVEIKENEKHDQLKYISLGIIDVLDSFERIEEGLNERNIEKNNEVIKIMNRYKILEKKLLNLLQKYGITKIEFDDNRLIVGLCEVIDTQAESGKKNDEIISIVRNGYIRGKELIRAAQIIVAKN